MSRCARFAISALIACAFATATSVARAQDDHGAHVAGADKKSCCEEVDEPLPPLPADATDKERWLRKIYDERDADEKAVFLNRRYADILRERLEQQSPDASVVERFSARWTLALFCVQVGDVEEGIKLCEECVALIDAHPDEGKDWLPDVLFRLAAAHFRLAERQNCIARHNEESCIFPLSERAVHVETKGPKAAIAVLERLLADDTHPLQYEARWMLNVAHMALGTWPAGVPEKFRIPAERFAGEVSLPRFVDRAASIGLARHDRAGSIIMDDFTGDGCLDLLECTFDVGKSLRLSKNDGKGSFEDISEAAGLARQLGGINLAQGDIDNDGRLDVAVVRGGGMYGSEEYPNSLLRQDRPGHFVDITQDAGVQIAAPSRAVAFADVDLDGDLDLFIGCETEGMPGAAPRFPSKLFVNDGAGRFADGTQASAIANPARCFGATFGDIDQDGDPDLFVSNVLADNRLFVNHADLQQAAFTEEAAARGVTQPLASGPAGFFDSDGDGDLDLFVTYQHHYRPIRTVAAWMIDGVIEDDTARLFENDGAGAFRDSTAERGLRRAMIATGLNFGDVDNDGAQDLYVATGGHDLAALFPNVLLVNRGSFKDATFSAGVGHLQKSNGVAFGDIDDDGDLDLAVQIGGWYLDDAFVDACFVNPGGGGHWLAIDLVGTKDNRFGIGARIKVRVTGPNGERDVYATVGSGASTGANPLRAHVGLGDATDVVFVEVAWAAAHETQRFDGSNGRISLDTRIRLTQAGAVAGGSPP